MSAKRRRTDMTARRTALAITALAIALAGCASKTVGSSSPSTSPAPSAIGSPPPNPQLSAQALASELARRAHPDTEKARAAEAALVANSLLRLVKLPAGARTGHESARRGTYGGSRIRDDQTHGGCALVFHCPRHDRLGADLRPDPPAGRIHQPGRWFGGLAVRGRSDACR